MNIVAKLTLEALGELGAGQLPVYENALTSACESCPPPFGTSDYGDLYRESATDPLWFAASLLANSLAEGDGSRRLWDLSVMTVDQEVAQFVKSHSVDEARHAQWYLAIIGLVFPDAVEAKLSEEAQGLVPRLQHKSTAPPRKNSPFAHDVTLDDLIQMNIAEIRTRIHHLLQRPLLIEHCPSQNRSQLTALLDRLLFDETKHIEYTAKLIESFACASGVHTVKCLMRDRLLDFNNLTEKEMNNREFPSCAQCNKCFVGL